MLQLFDRLRSLRPNDCKKIVPIQGDVLFEDLGISSKDMNTLAEEVSVVFHFAATLRLEAPLKDCVVMNTTGTQRALNVAKRLKNLAIFVHLSTAFCYPDYKVLEEKVGPAQCILSLYSDIYLIPKLIRKLMDLRAIHIAFYKYTVVVGECL